MQTTRRRWLHDARLAAALVVVLGAASMGGASSQALAAVPAAPTVPPLSTSSNPPACGIADQATPFPSTGDWSRTLVDTTLRLPSTYRPTDLVRVSQAGLTGGGYVRRVMLADLRAMAAAARAAGARLAVQSAYRSYATQVSTFRYWVRVSGYRSAIVASARPGHSEHQLGTAIDFRSYWGRAPWTYGRLDWAKTKAGAWLARNAWKYGFVMSYPKGKQSSVCYKYEPWHYRYYGRTVAAAIHASGLAPRVWLWRHGNNPGAVTPTPTPTPSPTESPTPTAAPTESPTPTAAPTESPTPTASAEPTPTAAPTESPAPTPTAAPTESPTPSAEPTPTAAPTESAAGT